MIYLTVQFNNVILNHWVTTLVKANDVTMENFHHMYVCMLDIDECSENTENCSQNCSIGSYQCSCNER